MSGNDDSATTFGPDDINDIEQMVEALRLVDEASSNTNGSGDKERTLWQAGEIFERIGDERGAAGVMISLARVYERDGRGDEADSAYQQGIEVYREAGLGHEAIEATVEYGQFQVRAGQIAEAAATYRRALDEARGADMRDLEGLVLLEMGVAAAGSGEELEGGKLLDQAAAVLRSAGDLTGLGRCFAETASVLALLGREDDAIDAYQQSIGTYLDAERDDLAAEVAEDLAGVFADRGDAALASKTNSEAAALRRRWSANRPAR